MTSNVILYGICEAATVSGCDDRSVHNIIIILLYSSVRVLYIKTHANITIMYYGSGEMRKKIVDNLHFFETLHAFTNTHNTYRYIL